MKIVNFRSLGEGAFFCDEEGKELFRKIGHLDDYLEWDVIIDAKGHEELVYRFSDSAIEFYFYDKEVGIPNEEELAALLGKIIKSAVA